MALALRYQECVGAPSKGRWWPQPGDTTYQHGVWKVRAPIVIRSNLMGRRHHVIE